MATVFIAGFAINLPSRFAEGDVIGETPADLLNNIQHRRIKARLRYLLGRGELASEEVQGKALELCNQELTPGSTFEDDDGEDPILSESMELARELINKRMAAEGLPSPKNIDLHARQLVDAVPAIQERARQRVEARYLAATASMGGAAA